jgi:hypothetical protein
VKSNPLSDSLEAVEDKSFEVRNFIEMKVDEILMREIQAMLKEHNTASV